MLPNNAGELAMNITSRFATDAPVRPIGWFLRLARQRRWFHESLFRTPHVERKPGPEDLPGKADIDTRRPSE